MIANGNPAVNIAGIRHVETVFRQGVGFDPANPIDEVAIFKFPPLTGETGTLTVSYGSTT